MSEKIKSAFFLSVRELTGRKRETFVTVSITTAVLLALIMLMMFLEAQWRDEVMPENSDNYHFYIQSLSASEKQWIREQPFVQCTYDMGNEFRVRVTWEYASSSLECCWKIFDHFDLWSRSPYAEPYRINYESLVIKYNDLWYGAKQKNGYTIAEMSAIGARSEMRFYVRNRHFCILTGTNYIVRPDNMLLVMLFALFLGMAVTLIYSEKYRRGLVRYGTLRAIGFEKWQIFAVFIFSAVMTAVISLIPASVLAFIVVKAFVLLSSLFEKDTFFTLLGYVPVSNILLSFCALLIAVIAGAITVCARYSNQEITDLLHARAVNTVSYVEKTSDRFEKAENAQLYPKLYSSRRRKSMLINSLIAIIMIPLPVYYILRCFILAFGEDNFSKLQLAYFIFQTLILALTAAGVIIMSALYRLRGRRRELSTLRALGMTVDDVKSIIRYGELRQARTSAFFSGLLLAAVIVMMKISMSSMSGHAIVYAAAAVAFGTVLTPLTYGVILLPQLLGIRLGCSAVSSDNITDSIREVE